MFESERNQTEFVTPHSHRYGLQCVVLEGAVQNTVYLPTAQWDEQDVDMWETSILSYQGQGQYTIEPHKIAGFRAVTSTYAAGETYYLNAADIHSIVFKKNTRVLIFESPTMHSISFILQPVVKGPDGSHSPIKTFDVKPWMFQ